MNMTVSAIVSNKKIGNIITSDKKSGVKIPSIKSADKKIVGNKSKVNTKSVSYAPSVREKFHGNTDIWLQQNLLRLLSKPYASKNIQYKNLQLVSRELIKNRRVNTSVQSRLFAKMQSCALVHSEVLAAASVYPILFSMESTSTPTALFSLQNDVNPFASGGALSSLAYVPAAIRQYPYVALSLSCNEDILLGIDASALEEASSVDGCLERLFFEDDSEISDTFDRVAEFCTAFQNEAIETIKIVNRLNDLNVFRIKKVVIKSANTGYREVGAYKVVDHDALKKLDEPTRIELADNGVLDLVLAHKKSLACIAKLGGALVSGC